VKISEEDLVWVIQKGLPETTIDEWKEDDVKMSEIRDQLSAIGKIISTLSGMHLYILFVSLS
jgi:hypothetical protein